jgi:hypothetical protein
MVKMKKLKTLNKEIKKLKKRLSLERKIRREIIYKRKRKLDWKKLKSNPVKYKIYLKKHKLFCKKWKAKKGNGN